MNVRPCVQLLVMCSDPGWLKIMSVYVVMVSDPSLSSIVWSDGGSGWCLVLWSSNALFDWKKMSGLLEQLWCVHRCRLISLHKV